MITEHMLQLFCRDESSEGRFNFEKPFTQYGYRYATDGKIIIRIKAPGSENTVGEYPQRAASLFEVKVKGWLKPFPDTKVEQLAVDCQDCKGTGKHKCQCPYCEVGECPECEGHGNHPGFKPDVVRLDNLLISGEMLLKIRTLPNPLFYATQRLLPVAFSFDGGEGVFMQRTDEPVEELKALPKDDTTF